MGNHDNEKEPDWKNISKKLCADEKLSKGCNDYIDNKIDEYIDLIRFNNKIINSDQNKPDLIYVFSIMGQLEQFPDKGAKPGIKGSDLLEYATKSIRIIQQAIWHEISTLIKENENFNYKDFSFLPQELVNATKQFSELRGSLEKLYEDKGVPPVHLKLYSANPVEESFITEVAEKGELGKALEKPLHTIADAKKTTSPTNAVSFSPELKDKARKAVSKKYFDTKAKSDNQSTRDPKIGDGRRHFFIPGQFTGISSKGK